MPAHATPNTALAKHHPLHGAQPVLPVPDVAAAARWFCDGLGFELDFLHGDPGGHRLRLGAEIVSTPAAAAGTSAG